jgi:hypothetical protein
MSLKVLDVLQNLEKTLREEFAESTSLKVNKILNLGLRPVEQERDDWKAKYELNQHEKEVWKTKYEQQQIKVQNLESFQKAVEIQVRSSHQQF